MNKTATTTVAISTDYRQFVEELKARVISARIAAARAITHEAILLYWDIGRGIVEKQKVHGWGDSVVEMVAADLQREFPGTKGFSPQNIWRMQQFYLLHNQEEFLAQVVSEMEHEGNSAPTGELLSQAVREMVATVPWGHYANALLRVIDPAARLWYRPRHRRALYGEAVRKQEGEGRRHLAPRKDHAKTCQPRLQADRFH